MTHRSTTFDNNSAPVSPKNDTTFYCTRPRTTRFYLRSAFYIEAYTDQATGLAARAVIQLEAEEPIGANVEMVFLERSLRQYPNRRSRHAFSRPCQQLEGIGVFLQPICRLETDISLKRIYDPDLVRELVDVARRNEVRAVLDRATTQPSELTGRVIK
jgi:hypothetical protein